MDKKTTLAAAALAALTLTAGCAAKNGGAVAAKGQCHGVNACKGQADCGGSGHACAGKNACKGQGWIALAKAECDSRGGRFGK